MIREVEIKTVKDALKLLPFEHKEDCCCDLCMQLAVVEGHIKAIIERLLAAERKPMECGHPRACLSPITVEYRDGTLEDAQECSFCVQLKAEREKVRETCANVSMIAAALYCGVPKRVRHAIEAEGYVQEHWESVFASIVADKIRQLGLTAPSSTEEEGKN